MLESISALLTVHIGSATLFVRPFAHGYPFLPHSHPSGFNVTRFLESREFPFRALYTAPIVHQGRSRATLVGCFGSWGASGEFLQLMTAEIAAEIGKTVTGAEVDAAASQNTGQELTHDRHAA